jgi:anti-anti-sigma factor
MHFERSETEDSSVLKVHGELTVECAKEFRSALMEELEKSDNILVDLEGLTEVDISGLQLLCSTSNTAEKLNKRFCLGNLPERFVQFANDTGYSFLPGLEAAEHS